MEHSLLQRLRTSILLSRMKNRKKICRIETNMKNILITGGSGFIGRNLREGLSAKFNIYAPRHSELDICNANMLERYVLDNGIEAVIHTAVHVPMINGSEHEYENDMLMFEHIE